MTNLFLKWYFVMDNIHNFIQIYIICRANAVPLSEQGKLLALVTEVGAKLMNDVDRIEWLCEPFQINHTYSLWKWHEKNQNYAWILFRSIYIIASAFTVQTVSVKERSCLSYAIGFNSDELHIYFFYKWWNGFDTIELSCQLCKWNENN